MRLTGIVLDNVTGRSVAAVESSHLPSRQMRSSRTLKLSRTLNQCRAPLVGRPDKGSARGTVRAGGRVRSDLARGSAASAESWINIA
jgi:hypothetical protein